MSYLATPTPDGLMNIRCPSCEALLLRMSGVGSVIEIKCKRCDQMIEIRPTVSVSLMSSSKSAVKPVVKPAAKSARPTARQGTE